MEDPCLKKLINITILSCLLISCLEGKKLVLTSGSAPHFIQGDKDENANYTITVWLGFDVNALTSRESLIYIKDQTNLTEIAFENSGGNADIYIDNTHIPGVMTASPDSNGFYWTYILFSCQTPGTTRDCVMYLKDSNNPVYNGSVTVAAADYTFSVSVGRNSIEETVPLDLKVYIDTFKFYTDLSYTDANPLDLHTNLLFLTKPYYSVGYTKRYRNLIKNNVSDGYTGSPHDYSKQTDLNNGINPFGGQIILPKIELVNYDLDRSIQLFFHGKLYLKEILNLSGKLLYDIDVYKIIDNVSNVEVFSFKFQIEYGSGSNNFQTIKAIATIQGGTHEMIINNPTFISQRAELNIEYLHIRLKSNAFMNNQTEVKVKSNLFNEISALASFIVEYDSTHSIGEENDNSFTQASTKLTTEDIPYLCSLTEISIFGGIHSSYLVDTNTAQGYGTVSLDSEKTFVFGCPNMTKVKRLDQDENQTFTTCEEETTLNYSNISNCYHSRSGSCYECEIGFGNSLASCDACSPNEIYNPIIQACFPSEQTVTTNYVNLTTLTGDAQHTTDIHTNNNTYDVFVLMEIEISSFDAFIISFADPLNSFNPKEDSTDQINFIQNFHETIFTSSSRKVYLHFKYDSIRTAVAFTPKTTSVPFSTKVMMYDYLNYFVSSFNGRLNCNEFSSFKYSPFNIGQGECISDCDSGYYASSSSEKCLSCPEDCISCTDGVCTECPESFYIHEGACLKCDLNCVSCNTTSFNCTTCQEGYISNTVNSYSVCQTDINYDPGNSIITQWVTTNTENADFDPDTIFTTDYSDICDVGEYLNPDNGLCVSCANGCEMCYSRDICEYCLPDFYLHNGLCIQNGTEATNYLHDESTTGFVSSVNNCDLTVGSSCAICNEGYYADQGNCKTCSTNCKSCTEGEDCTTCDSGYEYTEGLCVKTCSLNEYLKGEFCFPCDGCSDCNDCPDCFKCSNSINYSLAEKTHQIHLFF